MNGVNGGSSPFEHHVPNCTTPKSPKGKYVHFLVYDDVAPTSIVDVNLREHDLNPGDVLYLPLTNAEILEKSSYGRILTVDEAVEFKFLPKARAKDQDQNQNPHPPNPEVDWSGSDSSC